ncbi:MAG: T9SS type A sorting domain-containing protein [Chitinophagaceae bacterium]|nr:T9SS type A sorting domain-containing protein [Chitinophagaceae bacterium]
MKHIYSKLSKTILTLVLTLSMAAAFAATIVVPAGTTQTFTGSMNGTIFEVYGTLNFTPSGFNGSNNKVIAFAGGIVTIPSATSMQNVVLDIRKDGTLNIKATNFSMNNSNSGIINNGIINAASTTLTFKSGTGLQNSGTVNAGTLILESGAPVGILQQNTGTITVGQYFENAANYENAASGTINVTGPCSGLRCGFTTKNGLFKNSGLMDITGAVNIDANMELNGTMRVTGDLSIKRTVSGINGKLHVIKGRSEMVGDGHYKGTNMQFYDYDTPGNNFDSKTANNQSEDQYTVVAPPAAPAAALPLRFISFQAVTYNKFSVYFKFTTSVESALSSLQLQGSNNGKNYTIIESFKPHNQNGIFHYTSAHIDASKYTSYRIAVVNVDGQKEYSNIVFYKSSAASVETSIYPNPVTNATFNVKVSSAEPAIVNIYSNDGKLLSNTVLKGQQQYPIKMNAAAAKFNLLTVQVIQKGKIHSFTVVNN